MKKTVLIVDDSCVVRQQVTIALKAAGFAILQAVDGMDGLAALENNQGIDMVICDINMPNMNGLDMLDQVKGHPKHKALPVVMLTTEGQASMVKRAKEAGAVGWIVKPFKSPQLVQVVERLTKTEGQAC